MHSIEDPSGRSWSSDRGTTLTEVLVVLAISALVVPSIYMAVVSGFAQERTQEAAQTAEAQVRRVSDRLTEDISEGVPSDKRSGSPANQLSLEFVEGQGVLTRVLWTVDAGALSRHVLDGASGGTVSDVVLLEGVKVDGPIFRYWTATGSEITNGIRLANCSVRVTVSLRTVVDGGDASTVFDVAHRLPNPEAEPC